MNSIIENRKKIYQDFPKENLNSNSSNIVLFYDISNTDYDLLIKSTQKFLCKSIFIRNYFN